MRAYKRTISKEGGGDGDDWVEKKEFKQLLINLFYFNRLWKAFDGVDTGEKEEEKKTPQILDSWRGVLFFYLFIYLFILFHPVSSCSSFPCRR
jgi:hypothetical protein